MNYKQKLWISIGLTVLVCFFLVVFCVLPTLRGIVDSSKQLVLKRQELVSNEFLAQNFENFEKNFHRYEEGLDEMKTLLSQESLIDPEIPVNFIDFFQEQAATLNLSLKISPISFHKKEKESWDYMTFRIDGSGKFVDIMRFLRKLENSRWLVAEKNLSIGKYEEQEGRNPEGSSKGDFVKINLLIKVYAQSQYQD